MENNFERLFTETKRYVDLKLDQFKLQLASGLSAAISSALVLIIVLFLALMLLAILSYALMGWLNAILGGQAGTMIVAGLVLLAIVVIVLMRKRLFRDTFVKLLVDAFWNYEDEN